VSEPGNPGRNDPESPGRPDRRLADRRRGPRRQAEQGVAEERACQQVRALEAALALDRATAALRLGAERHRSLIAASGDMLTLKDPVGRMLEDIVGWEAFTGQTPEQWAGYGWMDALHPDDRASIEAWWRARPSEHEAHALESRLRRRDGVYRLVQARFAPVVDRKGDVREWLATIIDVTERRDTETRLRQVEEQFLQAQKMGAIGQFAGGVAHDFNNLLTVISAAAESLAAEPSLTPTAQEDLADLRSAAGQARDLTGRLLAFSRRQPEPARPLALGDVVREIEPLLRRLVGTSIQLETKLDEKTGCVLADKVQLEQVLANLVVNAKDAMRGGGKVTITVASADDLPADAQGPAVAREAAGAAAGSALGPLLTRGRYVRLSVRDTGTGMDSATQAHIFEPFFTTKPVGEGTGLGLSMVFGAVKQAGGAIRVSSTPGQGTTFDLYFPACPPAENGEGASTETATGAKRGRQQSTEAPATSRRVSTAPGAARACVLVVEDDLTLRRVITRILTGAGYEVLVAEHATAALDLLAQRSAATGGDPGVSLVITDLVMPEMMGQQLISTVHERWPDIPFLVVSGYAGDSAAAGDRPSGLDIPDWTALLRKPFGVAELLAEVRRLVRKR
jgi:PAS domain S-box-containing protein